MKEIQLIGIFCGKGIVFNQKLQRMEKEMLNILADTLYVATFQELPRRKVHWPEERPARRALESAEPRRRRRWLSFAGILG
ncbi:hypothetical protein OU426_06350 [Frigidibacter sp. RF13]|nr:hypothetical protein [Frigidibacter sp. RF13]